MIMHDSEAYLNNIFYPYCGRVAEVKARRRDQEPDVIPAEGSSEIYGAAARLVR